MTNITIKPPRLPEDIERASFAIIDSEVPEPRPFSGIRWEIARRLIHTSADFEMPSLLRFHPDAVDAGLAALRKGATIVTDTFMCLKGIPRRRLEPLGCRAVCFMEDAAVAERAKREGTTRASMAVDVAAAQDGPLIFAVGNAPTALLRLMELMGAGAVRPELVVAMPVGFVNAAESKELLMQSPGAPYIALQGRKGGSALAAACLNALAEAALRP